VAEDIDEISPQMWDAHLDRDDLQASHLFVRACQRSGVEDAKYRHILLTRGGKTVGTSTLACMDVRVELLAGPSVRRPIVATRKVFPNWLRFPVVLGGLPVSFGQSCLRVAHGEPPAPLVARFAEEAERFAVATGAKIICFKEMSATEAHAADELCDLGYFRAPSLPSYHLELPFANMEELEGSMRSGYRRQLRQTFRESRQSQLTVRLIDDWEPLGDTLFELYERVMDRAEYQLERLNRSFFDELRLAFGNQSNVITVERPNGEVLAYAIMLHGRRRSTFLITGIRYSAKSGLVAYRRVVAETIANALNHDARALEMGQTSYGIKTRLGAKDSARYLYLRARSPVLHGVLHKLGSVLFPNHKIPPRHVFRTART
jgi:hypothetical protein